MAYGQAISGFGEGAMRGLELSRQHRAQDEQREQRARQFDMQEERHGLSMDKMRSDMDFNEQYRPIQMESAQTGLEHKRQQMDQGQWQHLQQRAQAEAPIALNALERGDIDAVDGFLNSYLPQMSGSAPISLVHEGDTLIAMREGPDGELQERPTSMDEVRQNIMALGGIEGPGAGYSEPFEMHGGMYQRGPDGQIHSISGLSPSDMRDAEMSGMPEPVDLGTSDYNYMESVARRFWGTMNDQGQFFIPEGQNEKYAETVHRAGELARQGVPISEAAYISALSIDGPMSEEDARRQADKEASDQFSWRQRGERQEYIEQRVPELIEESQWAMRRYQDALQGQGTGRDRRSGAPAGSQGGGRGGAQDRGLQHAPTQPGRPAPGQPDPTMPQSGGNVERALEFAEDRMQHFPGPDQGGRPVANMQAGRGMNPSGYQFQPGRDERPTFNPAGVDTRDSAGARARQRVDEYGRDLGVALNPTHEQNVIRRGAQQGLELVDQGVRRAIGDETVDRADELVAQVPERANRVARGTVANLRGQVDMIRSIPGNVRDFFSGAPAQQPDDMTTAFFEKARRGEAPTEQELDAALEYRAQNRDAVNESGKQAILYWAEQFRDGSRQ